MEEEQFKKKLLHELKYPLYLRYGDLNPTDKLMNENNGSEKHQVKRAYRTFPIFKNIVLPRIKKITDESHNAL